MQLRKACFPMLVTLLGMSMEVKLVQREKAYIPILVTPSGMVMEVRPLQPPKASSPMLVTLEGMTVFLHPAMSVFVDFSIMALQLLRESYFVFPEATEIEVRPLQLKKGLNPMLVTLEGMVMEVRPVQP